MKYPNATWKPVSRYLSGGASASTMTEHNRLVLHTAVTSADSLYPTMSVPGTATSHFYVDGAGKVEQYVDTSIRSSANLDGNHDCITVETWDGYPAWSGSNVPDWTPEQVASLAELAAWVHNVHDIPLTQLPSSLPGTRGIGWHRLGIDGNFPVGLLSGRKSGGEVWSSSTGKVCPGDRRIIQTVNVIIPRAIELTKGESDMPLSDADLAKIKDIVDARVSALQKRVNQIASNQLTRERAETTTK